MVAQGGWIGSEGPGKGYISFSGSHKYVFMVLSSLAGKMFRKEESQNCQPCVVRPCKVPGTTNNLLSIRCPGLNPTSCKNVCQNKCVTSLRGHKDLWCFCRNKLTQLVPRCINGTTQMAFKNNHNKMLITILQAKCIYTLNYQKL